MVLYLLKTVLIKIKRQIYAAKKHRKNLKKTARFLRNLKNLPIAKKGNMDHQKLLRNVSNYAELFIDV